MEKTVLVITKAAWPEFSQRPATSGRCAADSAILKSAADQVDKLIADLRKNRENTSTSTILDH
jgi:hypothetical protein